MKKEDTCGPIWVFAEQEEGRIQDISLQLIGKARAIADELNTTLEVILLRQD